MYIKYVFGLIFEKYSLHISDCKTEVQHAANITIVYQ